MAKNVTKPANPKTSVREGEISQDEIARRAHEISYGPDGGTDEENWFRAEQELRAATDGHDPEESATAL